MKKINQMQYEIYEKVKAQLEKNALESYLHCNYKIGDILNACGVQKSLYEHACDDKIIEAENEILSNEEYFERYYNSVKLSLSSFSEEVLESNYFDLMEIFKAIYKTFLEDYEEVLDIFMNEYNCIEREGIVYELSDEEIDRIYNYKKRLLEVEEVRNHIMKHWTIKEFLDLFCFNDEELNLFKDDKLGDAYDNLLKNSTLLHKMYKEFEECLEDGAEYYEAMSYALETCAKDFSMAHPDFFSDYETIDTIAYKKYRDDYVKQHGCSESYLEYLNNKRKEYEDYLTRTEQVTWDISFEGYLRNIGCTLLSFNDDFSNFDYFLENEYLDKEYMKKILTEKEFNMYLKDI